MDASSLIPIPFLMILSDPSLPAPEHVTNYIEGEHSC